MNKTILNLKNLQSSSVKLVGNDVYVTDNSIKGSPGILLIWAHWCGACHGFIPTYKKLCEKIGKEFMCTAIEQGELKQSLSVMNALDIKYFPTIKFFDQNGRIVNIYPSDAPRTINDILDYICKFYHHCIIHH